MTQLGVAQPLGEETPLGLSPRNAWMNFALERKPLIDGEIMVSQTISVFFPGEGYVDVIVLSDDPGNSANKHVTVKVVETSWGGSKKPLPYLSQTRVPTSYLTQKRVRYGQERAFYKVAQGYDPDGLATLPAFSIGKHAQSKEAAALPNGTTYQRMTNDRYLPSTLASVVESLVDAGHKAELLDKKTGQPVFGSDGTTPIPDVKNIALSFGVRDDEIVSVNGKSVLKEELNELIQQLKTEWTIERIDEDGTSHIWHLNFRFVQSYAQSLGGIWAYLHTLSGDPAVQKSILLALDGGHKDFQSLYVDLQNGREITGGRIGDGGVILTDALRNAAMDHDLQLTALQSQEAYRKGFVIISGDEVPLEQIIDTEARQEAVESILSNAITPIDKHAEAHILFFGGFAASSPQELLALMAKKGKTTKQFFVCPSEIAAFMNAIGLFALMYYAVLQLKEKRDLLPAAVAARKIEEQQGQGQGASFHSGLLESNIKR